MRDQLRVLPTLARAAGVALLAGAIVAATLHFREAPLVAPGRSKEPDAAPDRLAGELERCRGLALQAKDDAACEAAWAESRRRFFTYRPAPTSAPKSAAAPKTPGR